MPTIETGQYFLEMDPTNDKLPDITFKSGDAPTEYVLVLEWTMHDGLSPQNLEKTA